jgi:hypothetical protein
MAAPKQVLCRASHLQPFHHHQFNSCKQIHLNSQSPNLFNHQFPVQIRSPQAKAALPTGPRHHAHPLRLCHHCAAKINPSPCSPRSHPLCSQTSTTPASSSQPQTHCSPISTPTSPDHAGLSLLCPVTQSRRAHSHRRPKLFH